jgi:hypothetical protein
MKTGVRMRTAKIMVSAAFTNWGKLQTETGSRTTRAGPHRVATVPAKKPIGA